MTQLSRANVSRAEQHLWNHLTDFTADSPRVPASQPVGSSQSSSTVPTRTSPPPKEFVSRPLPPLPPLRMTQSVGKPLVRSSTVDPPSSSQLSLSHSEPPAFPPPPQVRRFNTVEPVCAPSSPNAPSPSSMEDPPQSRPFETCEPEQVRSPSNAPSPLGSGGAWECREGEDILIEHQVERCSSERYSSRSSRSQDADNMGQCYFRIFEFGKYGYSLPSRRMAIRSCENWNQCISSC